MSSSSPLNNVRDMTNESYTYGSTIGKFIGLDGGLNTSTDPIALQVPHITTSSNVWNITSGAVRALPVSCINIGSPETMNAVFSLNTSLTGDPITTGDIMVCADVQDQTLGANWSQPQLLSGSGFGNLQPINSNPYYPFNVKTRPFSAINQPAAGSLTAGTFVGEPTLVPSSTLNYGIYLVPNGTTTITTTIYLVDLASNEQVASTSVTGTAPATAIEDTNNPGKWFISTVTTAFSSGPTSNTYKLYYTSISFPITGNPTISVTNIGTVNPATAPTWVGQQAQLIAYNGSNYWFITNAFSGAVNYYVVTSSSIGSPTAIGISGLFGFSVGILKNGATNLALVAFDNYLLKLQNVLTNTLLGTFTLSSGTSTCFASSIVGGSLNATIFLSLTASYGSQNINSVASITTQYTSGLSFSSATSYGMSASQGITLVSNGIIPFQTATATNNISSPICMVRTGPVDFYTTGNRTYTTPGYFLINNKCQIICKVGDYTPPIYQNLIGTVSLTGASNAASVVGPFTLSQPAYQSNPSADSLSRIIFGIYRYTVEGFNQGFYSTANLNLTYSNSTGYTSNQTGAAVTGTLQLGSIGPPNVILETTGLVMVSIPENLGFSSAVQAGRSLVFPGMTNMLYDGQNLVEANFFEPLKPPVAGSTVTTSGTIPAGNYLYRYIYRWQDANGQIHRSSPSPVLFVYQPVPWASQVVIPPQLTMTTFKGLKNVTTEMYRTDANGTSFYLVGTSVANLTAQTYYNNAFSPASTFYTTGVLDTTPNTNSTSFGVAYPGYWQYTYEASIPPPFISQCMSQGRHFGLACVDGNYRVYFTNIWSPGVTVEWNVTGYVTVPPEIGDCRAISAMDSEILVFGSLGVSTFNGLGPSNAPGQNNGVDLDIGVGFSSNTPIPTAAGIIGAGSPVLIPTGTIYQSAQGITLLDRSLTTNFIGKNIDSTTGVQGTSSTIYGAAKIVPTMQCIVFCNPSGDSLIYDYNQNKFSIWSTSIAGPIANIVQRQDDAIFTLQQAISGQTIPQTFSLNGVNYKSGIGYLYTNPIPANITITNSTYFTYPQFQVETPWIPLGQTMAGEGAFWDALILGSYFNPHQLKVEMAYNYQSYGIYSGDTQIFTVASAPPTGYQFRVHPALTARVWAVRIRVTILPPTTPNTTIQTDYARLNGIMIFSGTLQGNTRMSGGFSR